jgi:four helix bundle protein
LYGGFRLVARLMLSTSGMSRDHRKLDAFQLADALVIQVYRGTTSFPSIERYGLLAQLRRAAVSVPTNIVEGCARASEGEYLRFLDIAFASARELLYLIDLSTRLGFLDEHTRRELTTLGDRTAGKLSALRTSLGS